MKKAYRHGEIMFVEIDKLPTDLTLAKTKTIISGSNGNPHNYDNGSLYFHEDNYRLGYFVADNTTLYHSEHGEGKGKLKQAKLPNGIYEIRRALEKVNEELIPVID